MRYHCNTHGKVLSPEKAAARTHQPSIDGGAESEEFRPDVDLPNAIDMMPIGKMLFGLVSVGASTNSVDPAMAYGKDEGREYQNTSQLKTLSKFQKPSLNDVPLPSDARNIDWRAEYYIQRQDLLEKHQKEVLVFEKTNTELKAQHEANLADIQRRVFQKATKPYETKTDDDLQTELRKLRNAVTVWAKKSARLSLTEMTAEELEQVRSYILQTVLLDAEGIVFDKFIHQKKFLGLLLGALLSHCLHSEIIQNPFFFIVKPKAHHDDPLLDPVNYLDPGYMEMCDRMAEVHEPEAHRWRSERVQEFQSQEAPKLKGDEDITIQIFDAMAHEQSAIDDDARWTDLCEPPVDGACKQAREQFLKSLAGKLVDENKNDSQTQLDQVFMRARSLSLDLWARRSKITCSFMPQLCQEVYVEDSVRIIPHDLFLSDDHSTLEGKLFSVLVYPLVEVYGDEEGKQYSTGRILAPAVTWYLPHEV